MDRACFIFIRQSTHGRERLASQPPYRDINNIPVPEGADFCGVVLHGLNLFPSLDSIDQTERTCGIGTIVRVLFIQCDNEKAFTMRHQFRSGFSQTRQSPKTSRRNST